MKKLIREFIENQEDVIQEAKKIKEKYEKDIRVETHYLSSAQQSVEYYYYDPETDEIIDGAIFMGNGSQYSYKNIGDIEIVVFHNYDHDYIRINRIIRPRHEDMSYANEYEESKFNFTEEEIMEFQNEKLDKKEKYLENGKTISECIKCGDKHIVTQNGVENGEYALLNDNETKIVCSECIHPNTTIGEFLETISDEKKKKNIENISVGLVWTDMIGYYFNKNERKND